MKLVKKVLTGLFDELIGRSIQGIASVLIRSKSVCEL